jgi:hypothetical protein
LQNAASNLQELNRAPYGLWKQKGIDYINFLPFRSTPSRLKRKPESRVESRLEFLENLETSQAAEPLQGRAASREPISPTRAVYALPRVDFADPDRFTRSHESPTRTVYALPRIDFADPDCLLAFAFSLTRRVLTHLDSVTGSHGRTV